MANKTVTTAAQIDAWRTATSETHHLEFKEAKTQFDNEKLFQYCVAIANEGGGHLLLGVNNSPPRPIVGTSAFRDPLKMEEKILDSLRFRVDLEEVFHPDGRVLVCHIPSRPQGTAYSYKGTYPDSVIRELVANALIHQEFNIGGTSVVIEIFNDRLEITNPGVPRIPTDRFIDGCQSRNERFAMLMRRLRICEEKGSGIDRVVRVAEIMQLAAPDFRTGYESTTVVISRP